MNTNSLKRKTKAELIDIINSQNEQIVDFLSTKIDNIAVNGTTNNMLREKLNTLAKKLQEKEVEITRLKKAYDDNFDKQSQELQKTIIKYNSELRKKDTEIREKDTVYKSLIDKHKTLSDEVEELKLKEKSYETSIKSLSANINKLEFENSELNEEIEKKNEIIDNMSETIDQNELDSMDLIKELKHERTLIKSTNIIYIICIIITILLGIFVF